MYSSLPLFIFGFHGCDKQVAKNVINLKQPLKKSENTYDWLGNGIYFWENNPQRALNFAKEMKCINRKGKEKIKTPAVIGAVIDLGYCLNLLESDSIELVKIAHKLFVESQEKAGFPLPQNKPLKNSQDFLLRHLDCAVIESLHAYNQEKNKNQYDTVRGLFIEGDRIYDNSGIHEKDHIQICVRNPNCIKGFFYPQILANNHPRPGGNNADFYKKNN